MVRKRKVLVGLLLVCMLTLAQLNGALANSPADAVTSQPASIPSTDEDVSSADSYFSIASELSVAAETEGRAGIDRVMKAHGWEPISIGAAPIKPLGIDQTWLDLDLYAYRHDRLLQVAVYGEYSWLACEPPDSRASYDILGIDWYTNNSSYPLDLLKVDVSHPHRQSYRGENPSRQVITFNVGDCLDGTVWGVFAVPSGASGTRYSFNMKYTHTYLVTAKSHTQWSASLTWSPQGITGTASYSVQYTTDETGWNKGDFLSYKW